jgi:hypothetical protein
LAVSESYLHCACDRAGRSNLHGGGLRDVGSKLRAEFCHVVGEERGLVAGAGNGDVGEAGVEKVWVDAAIGVDQNAFGGKALRAVTGIRNWPLAIRNGLLK